MKKYVRLLKDFDWPEHDSRYNMNTDEAYEVLLTNQLTISDKVEYVLYNPHSNGMAKEAYFYDYDVEEITKESHPEYFL